MRLPWVGDPDLELKVDNYYTESGFAGVGGVARGTLRSPILNSKLVDPQDVEHIVMSRGEGFNNDHSGVNQWYRWSMAPNDMSAFQWYPFGLSPAGVVTPNDAPSVLNDANVYCHTTVIRVPPFPLITTPEYFRPLRSNATPPEPLLHDSLNPCN